MKPVLRLIEDHRVRTINDLVGDLFAPVSGQAVHHDSVIFGQSDEFRIDRESGERLPPLRGLLLLPHAGPGVGVDDVGALHRFARIARQGDTFIGGGRF